MPRLTRLLAYARGLLALRRDDVLLASFPRSGNTWMRFLLANLVSLGELGGRRVDFELLDRMMPELGVSDLRRPWPYTTLGRVVKTHREHWPFFRMCRSVLVIRDPRDVMVSYYRYARADRNVLYRGSFEEFASSREFGLPAWYRHYASWRDRAPLTLRYEEMRADPAAQLRRLVDLLGADLDDELIAEAVERSDIRRIRRIEEEGDAHGGKFDEGFRFAKDGGSGGWVDRFTPGLVELFGDLEGRYGAGYG